MAENAILELRDLRMHFPVKAGLFWQKKPGFARAVDGVSFAVSRGETLGLVGESGCGKTTLGRCILQIERPTSGQVLFLGRDIWQLSDEELRPFRSRMQHVFQDPMESLDPRFTAGEIVCEPLRIQGRSRKECRDRAFELLDLVGLAPYMAERYPHEFSVGQRQRLGVARSLALEADFIVCDEPVSALDVSIQAQIINLLDDIQQRLGIAYLLIAHDLAVVRHLSHRIAVMYLGKIVEISARDDMYRDPLHPYTEALLAAVPIPDPTVESARVPILLKGEVPSPLNSPPGCVFHPRCPRVLEPCTCVVPKLAEMEGGRQVSCLLYPSSWPASR